MPDESTASPRIKFVVRIVQEFDLEAANIGEAYAEMNRLTDRTDERASLIEGRGFLSPATEEDLARIKAEASLSS